jgi:prevent-host-death family protein
MKTVNIHAAKTHLSRLIEEVGNGEEIVIARAGRPVARLVAMDVPRGHRRGLGALKGRIRIRGDFDAPLPADLARAFGTRR